jgi:hypothetical protein
MACNMMDDAALEGTQAFPEKPAELVSGAPQSSAARAPCTDFPVLSACLTLPA